MNLEQRIDTVIDQALARKIVGCVILVKQNGKLVYSRAAGFADREAERSIEQNTIFRLASVTKPIVATVALRMMEAGLLQLDDPVTRFLPWFTPKTRDGKHHAITIRHLMSHTSGIRYDLPERVAKGLAGPIISLEENIKRVAEEPLEFVPGQGWVYGMGIDVLGAVIEAIEQSSLGAATAKYVTEPLAMKDTSFILTNSDRLSLAYADDEPPRLMRDPDVVLDPDGVPIVFSPGRIFNAQAPHSGGGGMVGTAHDIMTLLEIYQPKGSFLKAETRAMALTDQTEGAVHGKRDAGRGFSLIGGMVKDRVLAKTPCPNGSVDWGGVYGLSWIVDPIQERTIVICTNTALEGCTGVFPRDVRNAVYIP